MAIERRPETDIRGVALLAWKAFRRDNARQFAAAIAFFTVLALAPLLVLAIGLSGFFFAEEAARGEIVSEIGQFVGRDAGEAIQSLVRNASEGEGGGWASLLGVVALLWGASSIFTQLRVALNSILGIEPAETEGAAAWFRQRAVAVAGVLTVGLAIVLSVVANSVISRLEGQLDLPGSSFVWQALSLTLSLVILGGIITLVFRYIPDERTPWKTARTGAIVTTSLFALGQVLITLYLTYGNVGSSFGASSSLIVLIVWIYYSASIFFYGAEVMQVISGDANVVDPVPTDTARVKTTDASDTQNNRRGNVLGIAGAAGAGGCLGIFAGIGTAFVATLWFVLRNMLKLFRR